MATGKALIRALKDHILNVMRAESECAPGGPGLGNVELEKLGDLELHLDAQDHYLTYSLLHSLKDGVVEQVRRPDKPRSPKYRLRN